MAATDFQQPNNASTTYSQAAYQAAIAAGATPAQAAQYAGSQNQYADDPAEAKDIVPGEDYAAAVAREKKQGVPVGTPNFKAGDPTSSASTGSTLTNALQPQYTSAPPQSTAAIVDPTSEIEQILASYTPAAQQSTNNLNQSLAAAGVSGGGVVGAQQQLQGQLAAGLGSSLAGAIGGADAENQTSTNQANEFNTSNLINANNGNISTANNFEQFLASLQNGDWQSQLNAYTGLNESGLGAQEGVNSQAAGNFGVQSGAGAGVGALTGALGNYYGTASTPATTTPSSYSTSTPYDNQYTSDGSAYNGVY